MNSKPWPFLLAPMALVLATPLCASNPATARGFVAPAEIDSAVMAFTGAAVGQPGGARLPADPRLRLAACAAPLALDWHNPARTSIKVECPGPTPWRIYVAVAQTPSAQAPAAAIKRGDAVTITVRGRGFSVQQSGEAIEGGGIGDWIFVRTSRQAEPLRARIERPGLVVIPAI